MMELRGREAVLIDSGMEDGAVMMCVTVPDVVTIPSSYTIVLVFHERAWMHLCMGEGSVRQLSVLRLTSVIMIHDR